MLENNRTQIAFAAEDHSWRTHARRSGFYFREKSLGIAMVLVTYAMVGVVAWILLDVAWHGFSVINWEFLTSSPRRGGAAGGILPAIVGTLCLMGGTIVIALPLGMATAIYLSEYSRKGRGSRVIRMAIVTLAGVPSVVFGLFGLGFFVIFLHFGVSIAAGACTLACMILPVVVVSSEEALAAVPMGLREASLALGATKWQTVRLSVLPYALPGMLTGSILGIGRAAGETAPILLTAAAFSLPHLPRSVFDQIMALPYHLYVLATQHPRADLAVPRAYGTALVLVAIVTGVNLAAIVLRSRLRKKYRW